MRIAINSLFLSEPQTGSGEYTYWLIRKLSECDHANDYLLLADREPPPNLSLPAHFSWRQSVVPPAILRGGKNVRKLWWEQVGINQAVWYTGADLLHSPYFALPLLPACPAVVTIHDLIPLLLPAYRGSLAMRAYMLLVATAARSARMTLTDSKQSKSDIVTHLGLPAERVRVVYLSAAPVYRCLAGAELSQARQAVQERYGVGEQFIFYLGGLDQRKNVLGLIRAFARICRTHTGAPYTLLIAGDVNQTGGVLFPDPRPLIADLKLEGRVLFRWVANPDKLLLYNTATLFVFPSLYEGFGLTPLEAMACGAPVLCSSRSSLPEIVGEAGMLVDPEDPDQLGEAMLSLLEDESYRAELAKRGPIQARRFSWERTAEETLEAYYSCGL